MFARLLGAQFPPQKRKHCVCVLETLGVAAAGFLQGSAPHLLAVAVPLAPHPEHVGHIAGIGFLLWMHDYSFRFLCDWADNSRRLSRDRQEIVKNFLR